MTTRTTWQVRELTSTIGAELVGGDLDAGRRRLAAATSCTSTSSSSCATSTSTRRPRWRWPVGWARRPRRTRSCPAIRIIRRSSSSTAPAAGATPAGTPTSRSPSIRRPLRCSSPTRCPRSAATRCGRICAARTTPLAAPLRDLVDRLEAVHRISPLAYWGEPFDTALGRDDAQQLLDRRAARSLR